MKTFFTADSHFAHENILKITDRDLHFSNVEEHDDALLEGINCVVGENDRLFVLGDFAWRAGDTFVKRIRCRNLHLIYGNHDRSSFGKLFKSVEDTAIVKIQGHKVYLSHYPHAYWPASHRGSLHLYGHVHAEREETLDQAFPGRRSMDVGVDNAFLLLGKYRPFSEDEVIQILMARPGHDQIEWYDQQRAARRAGRPMTAAIHWAKVARDKARDKAQTEFQSETLGEPFPEKQPLPPTEVFYKKAMETSAEINRGAEEVVAENKRLRQALTDIAAPLDCGCKPCTGSCRSGEALEIELNARIDAACEVVKGNGTTAKELAKNLSEFFRKNGNYDT